MVLVILRLKIIILYLDCIGRRYIRDGTAATDISTRCKGQKPNCKDSGWVSGRCQKTCKACAGCKNDLLFHLTFY